MNALQGFVASARWNWKLSPSSDAGLGRIVDVRTLERLAVRNGAFTDAGLPQLQDLADLKSLVLGEAYYPDVAVNVTDQGLRHLASLDKLESLEISSTKLSGAGLAHLQALTSLASLRLKCPLLSDRELPALTLIKGLESLVLEQSQIVGPGLAPLQRPPRLSLYSCTVTTSPTKSFPFSVSFQQVLTSSWCTLV